MLQLLAQTTDIANKAPYIEVTLPAAITFAGVCGLVFLLIKLGDRLWRPNRAQGMSMGNDSVKGLCDNLEKLGNVCDRNREKIVENMAKLSEAMTRYIELQQASLKIAEYRHEAILKQLEVIAGQATEAQISNRAEFRATHDKLESIALSIGKSNNKAK